MKVLITGAGGQLGLDLIDAFAEHNVTGLTHEQLDVADETAVQGAVRALEPNLVIHSAAWTDVDGCEQNPERAHRVNALGSWWTARACREVGAAMVLVSTDYVFEGAGGETLPRPYREFDAVAPINAYGRSKVAAEQLVRGTLAEHHIVRTSWISGARGTNFVKTMLRLGSERQSVRVVDDQIGSPTFTRDLAAAIYEVATSGRYGTVHRTNSGHCSWYDLAVATFGLAGMDAEVEPIPTDDFPRPAPRPLWSVLSNRHAELAGLSTMPSWREGLEKLIAEL